jgi:hypothetical protein
MRLAYGNADGNSNCHIHSDGDCHSNGHIHADGDCHGDCDRHLDSDCHGDSNGNCERIAAAYTDATASAHTAAAWLALFRLGELAITNSRVPR